MVVLAVAAATTADDDDDDDEEEEDVEVSLFRSSSCDVPSSSATLPSTLACFNALLLLLLVFGMPLNSKGAR